MKPSNGPAPVARQPPNARSPPSSGGLTSSMNVQLAVLRPASVAVAVMVVTPGVNRVPAGGA